MRADLTGRGWRERENPTLDRFLDALEGVIDGLRRRAVVWVASACWVSSEVVCAKL